MLYEVTQNEINKLPKSSFNALGLNERAVQQLLKRDISPVADDVLVIGEEVSVWGDSRLRIDLLGIDKRANLVVVELKRDELGTAELQAIRYAAMISNLTFERAIDLYDGHTNANSDSEEHAKRGSAEQRLLEFLGWDEPEPDGFGNEVRIILVASDYAGAKELVTTVTWLNEFDLDIRCVRMTPYELGGQILLDVQTLVPLSELSDYQVSMREKRKSERSSRKRQRDYTKYNLQTVYGSHSRLAKRQLVCHLVSTALTQGISAPRIRDAVANMYSESVSKWMFTILDGEHNLEEVRHQLTNDQQTRYFLGDETTIHVEDGHTWILTNQWQGDDPHNVALAMRDAFPELQIEVSPAI